MIQVASNRYSTTGVVARKMGVVVHTTETGEDRLDVLLANAQRPGSRVSVGPNGSIYPYGSSYHAYANGALDGSYVQILPATAGPYSAPPTNKTWWHISIPGWARQSRAEWLEGWSRNQIRGVAKFIADKHRIDGFPLVKIGPEQLRAGAKGICGHVDVTYAWRQTDHTDPGPQFPWDTLLADVTNMLTDQEDTMIPALYRVDGTTAVWLQRPSTDTTIHVEWSTPGTPAVKAHIAGLLASGAQMRAVPLTACKGWTVHGPLPAVDKRTWTPADFHAVV